VHYSSGWLIVYDNRFLGQMKETRSTNGGTGKTTSYATPVRPAIKSLSQKTSAGSTSFDSSRVNYANEVSFSVEELVAYLMTQSNVIAAVESGAESLESVRTWLEVPCPRCSGGREVLLGLVVS
jgi:hypothetical protein